MTKRDIIKPLFTFLLLLTFFNANAQYKVKQVLIANGGIFYSTGNMVTIGSYSPDNKKYTLFDSVSGNSVSQVLIDNGFAYMATDSYLVKYDLGSLTRVGFTLCENLRYIAVYKNNIVATIGSDGTPVHLKMFKMSDLSLVYAEKNIPDIYCNGITVLGDSAYIALQGDYPSYNDTGKIAVEDLADQKFKRVITLDTSTKGVGDMFTNGNSIVAVTEYPYSRIAEINPTTGTQKIDSVYGIATPFALMNDTLYAGYSNDLVSGIGGYDLKTKATNYYVKPNPYYAAAALDTLNKLFYYTGGSYSTPTKTWISTYSGKITDSFDVGISPEGIAIDYEETSGINKPYALNDNLVLYPNPANDLLNITGISQKNAIVKIIDLTGRILYNETKNIDAHDITNIPVAQLNGGVYFITVQGADGFVSKQFVKN